MILVDGEAATGLPADDRGLAYGDGAFETLRIDDGRAPWLARHLERLDATCAALGFAMPAASAIADDVGRVAAGAARGVVKLVVTRGSGGRGYATTGAGAARRIVSAHPWPDGSRARWDEGVRVRWCSTRLAARSPLPGAKHLNRLTQVMARREWDDPAIAEGLLLDDSGAVVEGTMSNLFLVRDGCLVTPEITGGGVAGIARGWILERTAAFAAGGTARRIEPAELDAADELFVCNSVVGVWPVRALGERTWAAGPITRAVQRAFAAEGIGP